MRIAARIALGTALALAMAAQAGLANERDVEPVTDAMLQNPDPEDWLSWRRTLDSWGYSPLDQINRENVGQLRMVWARPLVDGHQEGTALVHDGVVYFPAPGDVIEAIDARSGDVIWQYRRDLPDDLGDYLPIWDTNRNVALYGNLVIGNGADNFLYALDAATGELVWETQILDYREGAKQSSGPIIANGLAITGRSCEPEGGPDACVITAHNALTGEEVWRTGTIARGDDPNSASWGDIPEDERLHVGAWMLASYDPELELVYMGTSVTVPAPKFQLAGNDLDYLYHNSTLALDVHTGRIVWHYQHIVDHWDLDHPFPRMLVDDEQAPDPAQVAWINPDIEAGRTYKVLTGVPGKTGVVYTLDRETGEFLWARPTVFQNVVQSIDGETGRVTVNPETVFTETGNPRLTCPAATGGANYMAGAYSPLTGTMYFPLINTCSNLTAVEPNSENPNYAIAGRQFIPPEANGLLGSIHAVSAVTGRTEWEHHQRAGMQSLMTTGGGLLFAGDADGRLRAMDQWSGDVLWEINLGSSVTGYPSTFAVDGQQYVAVSTGRWLSDVFTPELVHGTQNTLYVFALPEAGSGHRGVVREFEERPDGVFNAADPNLANRTPASRTVSQGVFNVAQARRGESVYAQACAACHGTDFQPAPGSPTVVGAAFLANWNGRSMSDLFTMVRTTMPPGAGGSLSEADYVAVLAFLLEANGFEPGEELPADLSGLQDIAFPE